MMMIPRLRQKENASSFALAFPFLNRRLDEQFPGAGSAPGIAVFAYLPMLRPACQPVFVAFMMFFTPAQSPAKAKDDAVPERAAASS